MTIQDDSDQPRPNDSDQPKPEDRFSFELWTVGNGGRDPFGDVVAPYDSPIASMLAEVGARGMNLHDTDLVRMDATAAERGLTVHEFRNAGRRHGIVVPNGNCFAVFPSHFSPWWIHCE
jgi:xylose isomerase